MGQSTLARRSDGAWDEARAQSLLFFGRAEVCQGRGWVGSPRCGQGPPPALVLPGCSSPSLSVRLLQMELDEFLSRK